LLQLLCQTAATREWIHCLERLSSHLDNSTKKCTTYAIDDTPWSGPHDKAAPVPDQLSASYYIAASNYTSNKKILLINITWSQKIASVDEFVDGYYMDIKPSSYVQGLKRRFDIDKMAIRRKYKSKVRFSYIFGLLSYQEVKPEEWYHISIHSIPMYSSGSKNPSLDVSVKIPRCGQLDGKLGDFEQCIRERYVYPAYEYDDLTTAEAPVPDQFIPNSGNSTAKTGAIIGISVTCIIIVVVTLLKLRKISKAVLSQPLLGSRLPPGGHVIVLVPTAGVVGRPLEWEFTQLLSDVINKSSDVTVTCNLWHMTEACSDVTGWFSDVISNSSNEVATHFVFVHPLASLSELDVKASASDVYSSARHYLRQGRLLSAVTTVRVVCFSGDDVTSEYATPCQVPLDCFHMPTEVGSLMTSLKCRQPDEVAVDQMRQLAQEVSETIV